MLDQTLKRAASKSPWVSWLITDGDAARSTRDFLNVCFANIPATKHSGILKKLSGAESQIEATVHELVAHELLRRLGLSPEFEPSLDGLTPDLVFKAGGELFLADVYLTHSPSKTFEDFGDGTGAARDTSKPDESRAHKIADNLAEKAGKYKPLCRPLVSFVFLGDHRSLSESDVERSLFGMTAYEASLEGRFPESVSRDRVPVGGLLFPDETGGYPYSNLSAVISCDWFDTLNQQDRGKRLHCFVLHNWAGQQLPTDAFRFFPQIIWTQIEPNVWKPEQTTAANIVAKFISDDGIEWREYTPNSTW
jgi:hypothetical protein